MTIILLTLVNLALSIAWISQGDALLAAVCGAGVGIGVMCIADDIVLERRK